jgi:hypothetical protein
MPRKRHHAAEEILTKLRQVDVLILQDRPIAEAVRSIAIVHDFRHILTLGIRRAEWRSSQVAKDAGV